DLISWKSKGMVLPSSWKFFPSLDMDTSCKKDLNLFLGNIRPYMVLEASSMTKELAQTASGKGNLISPRVLKVLESTSIRTKSLEIFGFNIWSPVVLP